MKEKTKGFIIFLIIGVSPAILLIIISLFLGGN